MALAPRLLELQYEPAYKRGLNKTLMNLTVFTFDTFTLKYILFYVTTQLAPRFAPCSCVKSWVKKGAALKNGHEPDGNRIERLARRSRERSAGGAMYLHV